MEKRAVVDPQSADLYGGYGGLSQTIGEQFMLQETGANEPRDLVAQLNEKISGLTDLVDKLQAKVTRLESRTPAPAFAAAGGAVASSEPLDRRRMLKGAGLAAAAGAAALVVVGKGTPAHAIVNPNLVLDQPNSATNNSTVNFTGAAQASKIVLLVNDTGYVADDSSWRASIAGWAGGSTTTDAGVYGYTEQDSGDIDGYAGAGVVGSCDAANAVGVYGRTGAGSAGVVGQGFNGSRAVIARASGTAQALWAHIDNPANNKDTVRADTTGAGTGIFASSSNGMGGKFQGKTAQVQLVPSTASSHPASGSAGQLFVDHSNRLWFCKGGTSWTQIA